MPALRTRNGYLDFHADWRWENWAFPGIMTEFTMPRLKNLRWVILFGPFRIVRGVRPPKLSLDDRCQAFLRQRDAIRRSPP